MLLFLIDILCFKSRSEGNFPLNIIFNGEILTRRQRSRRITLIYEYSKQNAAKNDRLRNISDGRKSALHPTTERWLCLKTLFIKIMVHHSNAGGCYRSTGTCDTTLMSETEVYSLKQSSSSWKHGQELSSAFTIQLIPHLK